MKFKKNNFSQLLYIYIIYLTVIALKWYNFTRIETQIFWPITEQKIMRKTFARRWLYFSIKVFLSIKAFKGKRKVYKSKI